MKKILIMILCVILALSSVACTANSKTEPEATVSAAPAIPDEPEEKAEPVTLRLMQFKPEITDQVYAMVDEYHKQFPNVTIEVEILQEDYMPVLKSKINADAMPDIFMSSGYTSYNSVLADYSYDFTGDPLLDIVPESVLTAATYNGGIYGIPMIAEGWGIIYNKDIFEECGITELPKTLEEFETACEAISAKGYTPFATGYKEGWILSHVFTKFYTSDATNSGLSLEEYANKVGTTYKFGENMQACEDFFDFIDIVMRYCEDNPVETDSNAQNSLFAQGKAAMMNQGSWNEVAILGINPDMNIGFMAVPSKDAKDTKLMVDCNIMYCLNKNSKNLEEAKKWYEWLLTSEYGEQFIVDECGYIPTVKGWHTPNSMLAKDLSAYMQEGTSYAAGNGYYPSGYFDESGSILQNYVVGSKTTEECNEELTATWNRILKG